ncbi:uncharacterized protein TNCV_3248881 [Trichonephila clavipes]|nr:uncharacterized protein TNCV_3248881 [Trichonephila clavipes]
MSTKSTKLAWGLGDLLQTDRLIETSAPAPQSPMVTYTGMDTFPRARHHSKQRRRWVDVKGSTRNGHRDPKCPSARCLLMVREDPGVHNEGANCAWMAAEEAVGCTRAFLTMVCRVSS